jgi:hypothetical protein
MQAIVIDTSELATERHYRVSGSRCALLQVDAPIQVALESGGARVPLDRPGRILLCGSARLSDLYVWTSSIVPGGKIVIVVSDDIEFDFPGLR